MAQAGGRVQQVVAHFDRKQLPRLVRKSLILHHQRAGKHVMQAAFAVCESNHDETDAEKHGRKDLGKKPPCGAPKANLIAGFIYYFEA